MMADEFTVKLDAYLDGELPSSEMKAIDAHVRDCPPCAADVLIRVQMKRATQAAGKRYSPSPEFRQRIQQQIASRPRQWASRAWMAASAVMAILLIAGILNSYIGRERLEQEHAFSEVADLHVAALASPNTVDVASSDRHTVKLYLPGTRGAGVAVRVRRAETCFLQLRNLDRRRAALHCDQRHDGRGS